jgi:hypothetical protein
VSIQRVVLAAAIASGCLVAGSTAETVVGTVTSLTATSAIVAPSTGPARSIAIARETRYMRWITHKPIQESTTADRSYLTVGRCVAVEIDKDGTTARLARISPDEVSTIWCPCR